MKFVNLLMLFVLFAGLSVCGCGGEGQNEVIVADPDVNYAGEYPEDEE